MNNYLYSYITELLFIFRPIVMNDDGMAPNKPVVIESASKSNACTETEDEETAAISTVIDAAELKWLDISPVCFLVPVTCNAGATFSYTFSNTDPFCLLMQGRYFIWRRTFWRKNYVGLPLW